MEVACLLKGKLNCFWCDIDLIFNQENGYYKCPDCGGEWWPGKVNYSVVTLWRDEQAYKKMMSTPGGGSSSSRRKKDKKNTAKQPWLHDS